MYSAADTANDEPKPKRKRAKAKAKATASKPAPVPVSEPAGTVEEPEPAPGLPPLPGEEDIIDAVVVDEAETVEGPRLSGPAAIGRRFAELGVTDRGERLEQVRAIIGRDIGSSKDLTPGEVRDVLAALSDDATVAADASPGADGGSSGPPEEPGGASTSRLSADDWRKLAREHRVKLVDVLRHASEVLGHKLTTIDDVAECGDPEIDRWLAEWIGGRS